MINLDDLKTTKQLSDCLDQHVVAALYKGDKPIVIAHNSADEVCLSAGQCSKLRGIQCTGIHAEINLASIIQEKGITITPEHFVVVTLQPCDNCIRALSQLGITNIYYVKHRPGCTWEDIVYGRCRVRLLEDYLDFERFGLITLFDEIIKYQNQLNKNNLPVSKQERVNLARLLILSMQSEINEVLNTMDWKYWRQTNGEIEYEHFKEEMADVFFFWVELLNVFNVPLKEIEEAITDKLMVNYNRMNGEQK